MVGELTSYWLARGRGVVLGSVEGGYDPDASALFARFTTPPADARKTLINTLIVTLKAAGVWAKLDALYLMAAADAQAARQNWIADQYNLTPISAPTFAADRGYTGDGVASYLDTGFIPISAVSPKFVQNSASFGIWSLTAGLNNQQVMGNNNCVILPTSSTTASLRVNNSTASSTGANTTSDGFFAANRSGAAAETLRRNTSAIVTGAGASSAVDNASITILKRTASFSSIQGSIGFIGSSQSTAESDAFYSANLTYLQAIGAA